jgi:hypothetical protein
MNKITRFSLSVGIVIGLVLAFAIQASTLWFGSYTNVNNTTAYSPTNSLVVLQYNPGVYQISDQGLATTNALTVNMQWSVDSNNFVTVATWIPTVTNAGTYVFAPGNVSQQVWQRFAIVTTNSVNVNILGP